MKCIAHIYNYSCTSLENRLQYDQLPIIDPPSISNHKKSNSFSISILPSCVYIAISIKPPFNKFLTCLDILMIFCYYSLIIIIISYYVYPYIYISLIIIILIRGNLKFNRYYLDKNIAIRNK